MSAMPTTVYYDGECPLCSREIAHYRSRVGDGPVSFVDIMKEDFAPAAARGSRSSPSGSAREGGQRLR